MTQGIYQNICMFFYFETVKNDCSKKKNIFAYQKFLLCIGKYFPVILWAVEKIFLPHFSEKKTFLRLILISDKILWVRYAS